MLYAMVLLNSTLSCEITSKGFVNIEVGEGSRAGEEIAGVLEGRLR
jgi:hypothetical protein